MRARIFRAAGFPVTMPRCSQNTSIADAKPKAFPRCPGVVRCRLDSVSYERDHVVRAAAPQQPQRYTFTELFRACNLPASASRLFTEPRARAEISVQNGRICIDLCLTEYYEYRIKRRVNGEERILADGFCESRVIDKDVCAGQRYTYTVTPFYRSDDGKLIYGPEPHAPVRLYQQAVSPAGATGWQQ